MRPLCLRLVCLGQQVMCVQKMRAITAVKMHLDGMRLHKCVCTSAFACTGLATNQHGSIRPRCYCKPRDWKDVSQRRKLEYATVLCRKLRYVSLTSMLAMPYPDLGVDLGSRLEVDLNVPSRLKSLLSTVKSVLSGTVCFVWSQLHNEKHLSCTWCSPPLLLILLIFTLIV